MILMDLGQAASELHCSERWLANNLRAGRFPAKKIGRKWVLDDDDIAAILQICAVTPDGFSSDSPVSFAPGSSITKTTLRRISTKSSPPGGDGPRIRTLARRAEGQEYGRPGRCRQ
jgi:hypothetical protein